MKVGSSIEEAAEGSSATVSSARTLKAKKAAVRAEVNFMVIWILPRQSRTELVADSYQGMNEMMGRGGEGNS